MAIQPVRPAGSSLTLFFNGDIEVDAVAQAAWPKANGELPSDIVTAVQSNVRFLLADATDPSDPTTRIAPTLFDDSQPAGASPHAPVLAGATTGVMVATDQIITSRTWAQNLDVTIVAAGTPAGNATAVAYDLDSVRVVLDLADSGLGGNTGLPVLVIPVTVTFAGAGGPPRIEDVSIAVTIRHSVVR